jgi:hypothetical protein
VFLNTVPQGFLPPDAVEDDDRCIAALGKQALYVAGNGHACQFDLFDIRDNLCLCTSGLQIVYIAHEVDYGVRLTPVGHPQQQMSDLAVKPATALV